MPRINRAVEYTDHAASRMRRRDIDDEDVLSAIEAPQSRHRHRKDGLWECWTRIPNIGLLEVVYEKRPDVIRVITITWE